MLSVRCFFPALLALCVSIPAVRAAAPATAPSHVQASLVAADASVQPGHNVVVALRLVHDEYWHTYWVNPGTGLPTTVSWTLPPGWKAGEIQWPPPYVLRDYTGTVIGQGYDGDTLLPVVLTTPPNLASGTSVTLKASVDWLMCSDVCVPGHADISLTLPVAATTPQTDPVWGDKVRAVMAALPRPDPHWVVTAMRDANAVTLHVQPAAGATHAPTDVWFFSEDGLVAYDQPQKSQPDGRGGVIVTLPLAADGPSDAKQLVGVLTSSSGWLADGTLRGLKIDAAFATGAAASTPNNEHSAASPMLTEQRPPVVSAAATGSVTQRSTLNSQPPNSLTPKAAGLSKPAQPLASGLASMLVLALLGGLILNLMPCVFPVLGIKILGFVNQAGHERRRVVAHGLAFTFGVLVSFWVLAGVLAALRAGGDELGWGFQLQSPAFVYGLAVLMLVFGMNMSGVFEFGLSATAVGSGLQMKTGYAGSFFSGVLATVVATPCSAPFLAPALGAALAVSLGASFAIFTAVAIGLAAPYLLLSLFPQAVKALPRPGAWMETFKQIMAFPLYATAAYLTWVLAAQTGDEGFRSVLFSFVLIALAVWMYGRWHAPGASRGRAGFAVASLIVVGAFGLWVGWPRPRPAPGSAAAAQEVAWQPWSPETVTQLRREGRVVYVDFTARWCATCQANKRLVFHDDAVLKYFADHKIATLRADWTNRDPRITEALARYGRSAVPFNLIWLPGQDQPVILPEILTPATVLSALRKS